VTNLLTTAGLPDPDLIIRTSGETRISNFMLWQSAYAEYEFIPTLWPDFTTRDLETIVQRFRARDRRFGAVPDALGVKMNRKAT
jgi:undecaprenyl diphosphate synthase